MGRRARSRAQRQAKVNLDSGRVVSANSGAKQFFDQCDKRARTQKLLDQMKGKK